MSKHTNHSSNQTATLYNFTIPYFMYGAPKNTLQTLHSTNHFSYCRLGYRWCRHTRLQDETRHCERHRTSRPERKMKEVDTYFSLRGIILSFINCLNACNDTITIAWYPSNRVVSMICITSFHQSRKNDGPNLIWVSLTSLIRRKKLWQERTIRVCTEVCEIKGYGSEWERHLICVNCL